MQKRIIIYILTICSLVSACEFDYTLDGNPNAFTPKITLSSFINPADDIVISMGWTKHYTAQEYPSSKPKGKAKLYEDGILVNETAIDEKYGDIYTYYKAKAGKSYKIIVDVEDYGIVEAETSIPDIGSASVQGEFLERRNTQEDDCSFYHAQLNEITAPHSIRAVWVRAKVAYKFKNEYEDLRLLSGSAMDKIYTNNLYVDNFNIGTEGDDEIYEGNILASGGVLFYNKSIRIPYQLIELSQPLAIAILCKDSITLGVQVMPDFSENMQNEIVTVPVSDVVVQVIYPSDDFDKYVKGVYRQSELIFDASFPMFSETVYIHSNIKNGLGIFAGYNSIKLDLPTKK